jgi:hypothetical protein
MDHKDKEILTIILRHLGAIIRHLGGIFSALTEYLARHAAG